MIWQDLMSFFAPMRSNSFAFINAMSIPSGRRQSLHSAAQCALGRKEAAKNRRSRQLMDDLAGRQNLDKEDSLAVVGNNEDSHHKVRLTWLSKGVKNALASYIATLLSKIVLQPFDTIKTIQQMPISASSGILGRLSVSQAALLALRERGIFRGLWAGTWVSAFGAAPSVAVYFGVFSACKTRLATVLPLSQRYLAVALAASVANTVAAVFRVPYEVFKQRLQSGAHSTLQETVMFTIRQEKVLGIFGSGRLLSQILRDVPYAVLTAVLYDLMQVSLQQYVKKQQQQQQQQQFQQQLRFNSRSPRLVLRSEWIDAISGAVAGGVSTLLTTPLDVVKTRLMASAQSEFASVGAAVLRIWEQEGMFGFFRGGASRLMHKVPANALFFACYEMLRSVLGAVDSRSEQ